MQPIRDAHIARLVERIGEHYRANISNRFIRPALLHLSLDKEIWDQIEVFTEKFEQFRYQGFHLDDLYQQLAATTQLVSVIRQDLLPSLRNRMGNDKSSDPDKVLRDMAANNFDSNLRMFITLLNELLETLIEFDKNASKGKNPVYLQIPEIKDTRRILAEENTEKQ